MLMVEGFGVCVILVLGSAFRWWSHLAEVRSPIRERLLRSPGESLRQNLEQLNEYLIYSVALFIGAPALFAWQTPNLLSFWPLTFLTLFMVLCAVPGVWVVQLYRNYALGLRGERAVGEELNQLMFDGCHVFHDYPAGPNWNIDHIVVAPSGVYAIETKTRRKRQSTEEQGRRHEAEFDGDTLRFPHYTTREPIVQAQRNAATLARELTQAVAEPVNVKTILTLPGWFIVRPARSEVHVLNPKEIFQVIVTPAAPELSAAQIQRIAHYLQQKCRDVEL